LALLLPKANQPGKSSKTPNNQRYKSSGSGKIDRSNKTSGRLEKKKLSFFACAKPQELASYGLE